MKLSFVVNHLEMSKEFQEALQQALLDTIEQVKENTLSSLNQAYLTKSESCSFLHVSPVTLNKWINRGLLHPSVIDGVCRLKRSDLEKFMTESQK